MLDLLALIGAALLAVGGAFFVGRRGGKLSEREAQEKRAFDALLTRKEVDNELRSKSPDDIQRELDGWLRDDDR